MGLAATQFTSAISIQDETSLGETEIEQPVRLCGNMIGTVSAATDTEDAQTPITASSVCCMLSYNKFQLILT